MPTYTNSIAMDDYGTLYTMAHLEYQEKVTHDMIKISKLAKW